MSQNLETTYNPKAIEARLYENGVIISISMLRWTEVKSPLQP